MAYYNTFLNDYSRLHDAENLTKILANVSIEDVIEFYGIEKIENYIRMKKIERLQNGKR